MKKLLFSVISLIFLSGTQIIHGQEPDNKKKNPCTFPFSTQTFDKNEIDILYYDFSTGDFFYEGNRVVSLGKVRASSNHGFRLAVLNINRYNYDVEISLDNISFNSKQPELFGKLFLGEGGFIDPFFEKSITRIKVEETTIFKGDSLQFKLKHFLEEYYKLFDMRVSAYDFCPPNPGKQSESEYYISDIGKRLLDLRIEYAMRLNKQSSELIELSEKIKKADTDLKDCESKKTKLESDLADLKDIPRNKDARKNLETLLEKLQYNKKKDDLDKLKDDKKRLDQYNKSIEDLWSQVSKITNMDLIELTHFQKNYIDEHFRYVSPTIFPDGNLLRIGLRFSPSDSGMAIKLNMMPLRNDSLSLDIFVKRHPFFTFSSGPFTGLGNDLLNEVWGWQPQPGPEDNVTDSSKYKLVNCGNTGSMTGIAAYANISMKLWKWFGISLSTGVGISIESSPRPAFLLGGALDFGKNQVLSLAGGWILTYADRLSTALYPNLSTTLFDNAQPISYTREAVSGAYVSMTYTLFTLNRQHGVKSGGKK